MPICPRALVKTVRFRRAVAAVAGTATLLGGYALFTPVVTAAGVKPGAVGLYDRQHQPQAAYLSTLGGWVVNGRKIFGTQSIALDLYFTEATCDNGPEQVTIINP